MTGRNVPLRIIREYSYRKVSLHFVFLLVSAIFGLGLAFNTSRAAELQASGKPLGDHGPGVRLDSVQAPVGQTGQSGITSPEPGSTVSGPVPIVGTATDSSFARFELYFKQEPSGDEAYSYFAGETRQIVNGQLGVWQTDVLSPGIYTLRMRVVYPNGNYGEFFVSNITVGSEPATPTPDAPTATPIPIDTPTPFPQPTVSTVQVEQPNIGGTTEEPTETPPPSGQNTGNGSTQDQASTSGQTEIVTQPGILGDLGESLSLDRLRARFFIGVRWSAGLFLVLAAIFAAKRLLEWVVVKNE